MFVLTAITLIFTSGIAQISIAPFVNFVEIDKGQAQAVLTIGNPSEEAFRVRLVAIPFTYSDNGLVSLPSGVKSDLNPYLQIAPQELVIPANQKRRVRMVAHIPPSVLLGEHRVVLFAEKLTPNLSTGNSVGPSVGIKTRVGSTLFVQSPDAAPNISASGAKVDVGQLQMLLTNSGDASAQVVAKWQLKPLNSNDVVVEGETGRITIVAATERYIRLINDLSIDAGQYVISGTLVLYQNPNVLGNFTFETTLDITEP